jgi:hypothetical protein
MSKEQTYDSEINPLMAQIIAICKRAGIACPLHLRHFAGPGGRRRAADGDDVPARRERGTARRDRPGAGRNHGDPGVRGIRDHGHSRREQAMSEHSRGPWGVFVPSSAAYPGIESPDGSVVIWGRECDDDGGVRGRTVG